MIKECLPKVGFKLLKIPHIRILFLVSFLFVAVINPYSVKSVFKFLNILVFNIAMLCMQMLPYKQHAHAGYYRN